MQFTKGVFAMFDVKVVSKQSKSGQDYVCLEITFPNGYTKVVYLDKAEQYLAMSNV